MGASLIAPVALLLAAVVVATGGGGLGGLGSLGQISAGPTLPDIGPVSTPRASLEEAELATAGLAPAATVAPGVAGGGPGGASTPVTGGGPEGPGGGPGGAITPVFGPPGSPPPATGQPPGAVPPASAPQPPAAPPADPVGDVIDTTRGLGESLPAPLGPTTGDIADSLLGPKP